MRIMAVDYGDARTGVAISDATGFLTGFTTVVPGRRAEPVAQKIAALIQEHGVEEVVLGFPRNMDGTEGARADLYRAFAALLDTAPVGFVENTKLDAPARYNERDCVLEINTEYSAGQVFAALATEISYARIHDRGMKIGRASCRERVLCSV